VLVIGYCVPCVTSSLSAVAAAPTPLFKSQMPRSGRTSARPPNSDDVHRRRYSRRCEAKALGKLSKALASFTIGDPLDEATQLGPLSNEAHFKKVEPHRYRRRFATAKS
jgi:hypothetical protein